MLTLKSLGRGSKLLAVITVVAVMTISVSSLAIAAGASATTPKSKQDTKSAKTIPHTVKTTHQIAKSIPHTPALLKAVRRIEIKKAQEYRCTKARRWLRYQKGLRTRYAKRLTELGTWEKQAVAAHDTLKAAGLNTDIARVKARQFRNVLSKPMLKFSAKTQRVGARCEAKMAKAKNRPASAKMRAAEIRAAEIRAAEIKAAMAKAAKAKAAKAAAPTTTTPTTAPTSTTPTTSTPTTSTTVPSTSATTSPARTSGSTTTSTTTSSPQTSS
jgi:hypothetical protein